jgi:RimJ/RimL family protein N-acetyltransferase
MGGLPTIEGTHVVLRPFTQTDAPLVELMAGKREVADTTLLIPHPYPAGAAHEWIASHDQLWALRSDLPLAIWQRGASETFVGAVNLMLSLAHAHGEIGYWVGLQYWSHGFATAAARLITDFAFAELRLHRVQGRHFLRNPASGRVLQKIGMRREGVHRDAFRRWDRFEDVASYAVLSSEWRAGAEAAFADATRAR